QYVDDPWSMLRPGDGGYSIPAAVAGVLALAAWRAYRNPPLRNALAWAVLPGLLGWAMLAGALLQLQRATIALPEETLTRLDGGSMSLSQAIGTPVVVNLWASWCPPCRREMPVLAQAQRAHPQATFVFVNQGESGDDIRH